jgi:hypothetical protein
LYDPRDSPAAVHPGEFVRVPLARRTSLKLVFGHFLYGIHRYIPGPSSYVTVLRDPLDRIVSLYHHVKLRGHGELRALLDAGMTLNDYVLSGKSLETDNQMVRQIAGPPGVLFGQCTDALLEDAMEHIERRFGAVLFYEDMQPGLRRLASLIGHSGGFVLPRENPTPSRTLAEDVDAPVRDRILELNRFDVALYQWARDRSSRLEDLP